MSAGLRYSATASVVVLLITLAFMQILPRPDALSSEASASRLLETMLVLAALTVSLSMPRAGAGRSMPDSARAGITIVLAFAAWAFLTAFWSHLTLTTAVKALELAALATTAYRLVAAAPVDGTEPRLAVCNAGAVGLSVALVVLLAANVVYWGTPLHIVAESGVDPFTEAARKRLALGQNHPLSSALFLAVAMVFLVNCSLRTAAKLAGAAVLGALLLLCNARATTTALPASLLLCMFLRSQPSLTNAWARTVVVFAGIGSVLLLLPYLDLGQLLPNVFGSDVASLNSRTDLWVYALGLALDHPLGGVGYFGARQELLRAFPFAGHAHNTLLEIFLTTGLLGATFLLVFVALTFVRLARTSDPLLGGLLPLILVEGNLNPVLFVPGLPMFLFMVALFGSRVSLRRHSVVARAGYGAPIRRHLLSGVQR